MKRSVMLSLALILAPLVAMAMPVVGDNVGTGADRVKAALEKAGCVVSSLESEGGKVEAICTETATSKAWDVSVDPTSGLIVAIKASED